MVVPIISHFRQGQAATIVLINIIGWIYNLSINCYLQKN